MSGTCALHILEPDHALFQLVCNNNSVHTLWTSLNPPFPNKFNNKYLSLRIGWSLNLKQNIQSVQAPQMITQLKSVH